MPQQQLPRRTLLTSAAAGLALASGLAPARAVFGAAERPRIKLGQVGTAHAHANKLAVYRGSAEYEVVGVVEPDEKRWAAAQDQPAYRGLKRMTE